MRESARLRLASVLNHHNQKENKQNVTLYLWKLHALHSKPYIDRSWFNHIPRQIKRVELIALCVLPYCFKFVRQTKQPNIIKTQKYANKINSNNNSSRSFGFVYCAWHTQMKLQWINNTQTPKQEYASKGIEFSSQLVTNALCSHISSSDGIA